MKIIDGNHAILGRVASFAAKQALYGEDVAIVNCENLVITGNKEFVKEEFERKRGKHGTSQKGPIQSKNPERIVKRVVRGMLPNHRWGRGKAAIKKIKCYVGVPKMFEKEKKIKMEAKGLRKFSFVKEYGK